MLIGAWQTLNGGEQVPDGDDARCNLKVTRIYPDTFISRMVLNGYDKGLCQKSSDCVYSVVARKPKETFRF